MNDARPEIQPIANLVINDGAGGVVLVRYRADDEPDPSDRTLRSGRAPTAPASPARACRRTR